MLDVNSWFSRPAYTRPATVTWIESHTVSVYSDFVARNEAYLGHGYSPPPPPPPPSPPSPPPIPRPRGLVLMMASKTPFPTFKRVLPARSRLERHRLGLSTGVGGFLPGTSRCDECEWPMCEWLLTWLESIWTGCSLLADQRRGRRVNSRAAIATEEIFMTYRDSTAA